MLVNIQIEEPREEFPVQEKKKKEQKKPQKKPQNTTQSKKTLKKQTNKINEKLKSSLLFPKSHLHEGRETQANQPG